MSNFIHPTAVIDATVVLGDNNYIGPYCVIQGDVLIGNNNRFEAFCSVGAPAEHVKHLTNYGPVRIGDRNVFREYVSIHGGTVRDTVVGNDNLFLNKSYISHDSIIEDKVTMSMGAVIGGHCHLMKGCNLGINVSVHQFSVIGSFAMIGMGGVVAKKSVIQPTEIYVGSPVQRLKTNLIAIERNNLTWSDVKNETERFWSILNEGK